MKLLQRLRSSTGRLFPIKAQQPRRRGGHPLLRYRHDDAKLLASDADLFQYTSGRWLYNESHRLAERHLEFNVAELKNVAAKALSKEECSVQKISNLAEGGFNRIFEISMDDGLKVIARLPYPTTMPKRYAVASEVATINLVRSYGVPAPRVYGYDATADNAVGSEYILMDKLEGHDIGSRWYDLSTSERKIITLDIAKLEALLFSIQLPASGSIYYKKDLASTDSSVEIPNHPDFCVGPDAALGWWFDRRDQLSIKRGPFQQATEAMAAGAQKELAWLKQFGRPRFPFHRHQRDILNYHKSKHIEHIQSLEKYLKISKYLVPSAADPLQRPTIRHPDLQPRNIVVSDDSHVTGLIDWQHCSVLPLFLQAGVPKYWQNVTDGPTVMEVPRLPQNYEQLDEPAKSRAMEEFRQRQVHMLYLAGTSKFNKAHLDAYSIPGAAFKRRLFNNAGAPWEGNNVFLQADLVLATRNWQGLAGDAPECPITFDADQAEEYLRLQTLLTERDSEMEDVRDSIGVSSDGWIPHDGYAAAVERNKFIKHKVLDSNEHDALPKELALAHYPFDDHDEDE